MLCSELHYIKLFLDSLVVPDEIDELLVEYLADLEAL